MSLDPDAGGLARDIAAAEQNHTRLVSEAAHLGAQPSARFAWELVHEAAGITATLRSRHQHQQPKDAA